MSNLTLTDVNGDTYKLTEESFETISEIMDNTQVSVDAISSTPAFSDVLLGHILRVLIPSGTLRIIGGSEYSQVLLFSGFVSISEEDGVVSGLKPSWSANDSADIKVNTNSRVWTFTGDHDLDDEDALLENEMFVPVAKKYEECGTKDTSGKKRACKDCSCGLAEEQNGLPAPEVKSACGSCYLGDAFRCSSCPYLGQPAFAAGNAVKLQL